MKQDEFQKRRAERRKKIRRRRMIIGFTVFLCLSAAVFILLSLTILFPVKKIVVSGESRYTNEEIIEASGLGTDTNIFTFSTSDTIKNIEKSLPYLGKIDVERSLPDTVNIKIKSEKSEFATYLVNGVYYAVSEDHFVLNSYAERPKALFLINCENIKCEVGEKVKFEDKKIKEATLLLVDELTKRDISINEITVNNPSSLLAVVENRFEVKFGGVIYLENKVAHLKKTIADQKEDETGRIDLSFWEPPIGQCTFIPSDIVLNSEQDGQAAKNNAENS